MKFWLGTPEPAWLARLDVPLMVSHRRLARRLAPRRSLPRARAPWVLDSGGFSELTRYGRWETSPADYVGAVRRYRDEVGRLAWAAPQDWMVEPAMLARTGLDIAEHQRRTVANLLELRARAPELPFIPVVQGWTVDDYRRCVDLYDAAGVDLRAEALVGVGSVCRRQSAGAVEEVLVTLRWEGLRLHGFGVKAGGWRFADLLESADSQAWSLNARKHPPLDGCAHGRDGLGRCSYCARWALRWRERLLADPGGPLHLTP